VRLTETGLVPLTRATVRPSTRLEASTARRGFGGGCHSWLGCRHLCGLQFKRFEESGAGGQLGAACWWHREGMPCRHGRVAAAAALAGFDSGAVAVAAVRSREAAGRCSRRRSGLGELGASCLLLLAARGFFRGVRGRLGELGGALFRVGGQGPRSAWNSSDDLSGRPRSCGREGGARRRGGRGLSRRRTAVPPGVAPGKAAACPWLRGSCWRGRCGGRGRKRSTYGGRVASAFSDG